jgi:hypothetical protein
MTANPSAKPMRLNQRFTAFRAGSGNPRSWRLRARPGRSASLSRGSVRKALKAFLDQLEELEAKWRDLPEEQKLVLPELAKFFGTIRS